ncbi:MAG: hypothetical protein ACE5EV_02250 [Gaiellales bacterium]
MDSPGRSKHDLGGLAAGAVDRSEHDPQFWEKRVDALMMLLVGARRLMTVDELRRGIEELGDDDYRDLSYYERWIASITHALLEKGLISADELGRRMSEIEGREAATSG